jgi:biopolymer transport protein ExbD
MAEEFVQPTEASDDVNHYVSDRQNRAPKAASVQPPLTPMIDVTFQLLLYFLLTSTFQPNEGEIPGTLPKEGPTTVAPPPLNPIRVTVSPEGMMAENAQYQVARLAPVTTPEELFEALAGQKNRHPGTDVPVVIKPQGDVRWQFVTEVFNAAVRAKFKKIGFARSG